MIETRPKQRNADAEKRLSPRAVHSRGGEPGSSKVKKGRLAEVAEAYALVVLTIALLVFFWALPSTRDAFPTTDNLRIVAADQAVLLMISIAVLVPMVGGTWDFTPGATTGITAVFAATTVQSSGSIMVAILAAVGVGLAVGVVNGLLITKARINSVIATLGMTLVISGVVQWKTGGSTIVTGIPSGLVNFGADYTLSVPNLAWVGILTALVISFTLSRTIYGRRLYAVGANRAAARLVGLRNERLVFSTYLISGALCGIAGVLLLARTGTGNPAAGPAYILPAYAAVFLGASAITPGRWNVWGTVTAVVFLGILNNGLTLAGANSYVNSLVNGAALIGGVGIANALARRRGRTLEMT